MRVTHEEALNTHIGRLRKVRGVTQEELGRALGVSQATASRKLHGLIPFSAEEVARCADYFRSSRRKPLRRAPEKHFNDPEEGPVTDPPEGARHAELP